MRRHIRNSEFQIWCFRLRFVVLFALSVLCFVLLSLLQMQFTFVGDVFEQVSWYRTNRDLTKFLHGTSCIVCPKKLTVCSSFLDQVTVTYFVTSHPSNKLQRAAIRKTWGAAIRPRPIFVTGTVDDEVVMDFAKNEAKLYGDVIIENFQDTYSNLTLKTSFILKHFLRLCPNSLYLMKTDDDMFINPKIVENIINDHIQNTSNTERLGIIGKVVPPVQPHRDIESKWYLPYWLYNFDLLPPYISGTGYLVPGRDIQDIFSAIKKIPSIPLEDVYFTGLVANKTCGIPLIHDNRFREDKPLISYPCIYKNLATAHRVQPDELISIWENLKSDNINCSNMIALYEKYYKLDKLMN